MKTSGKGKRRESGKRRNERGTIGTECGVSGMPGDMARGVNRMAGRNLVQLIEGGARRILRTPPGA